MKFKVIALLLVSILFSSIVVGVVSKSEAAEQSVENQCNIEGVDLQIPPDYKNYIWLNGENVDEVNCSKIDEYRFSENSRSQERISSIVELSLLVFISILFFSPLLIMLFYIYRSGNRLIHLKKLAIGLVTSFATSFLALLFLDQIGSIDLSGEFALLIVIISNISILSYLFNRDRRKEEVGKNWKRKTSIYLSSLLLGIIIGSWIYFNYFYHPIIAF